jgi:DNA-binding transcriptional MerR regulator
MTKLNGYVKTAAVAELIGVAQNTLRKWAERSDIPMRRNPANGYRMFRREDFTKFLEQTSRPVKPSKRRKPK